MVPFFGILSALWVRVRVRVRVRVGEGREQTIINHAITEIVDQK
jgi:hypothetical protein